MMTIRNGALTFNWQHLQLTCVRLVPGYGVGQGEVSSTYNLQCHLEGCV